MTVTKRRMLVGLFSANYNKPGPGVEKDAPPKPRFFIFFDVLKRKFWHVMKINLMFVLFNLPALFVAFIVASNFLQKLKIDEGLGDFYVRFFLAAVMTLIPVITIGPVQAGITYILRNYSREEHSFIWWDFKENFTKNFKQGMIITVIDIVVMYILGIAINFYTSQSGLIYIAATSFVFLSLIVYLIMHLYIYPMLVTVHLSIKDLYRNAFIFSILKLLPNVLFLALNMVIAYAAFYNIVVGLLIYVLILPGFMGLMNNFYVNPIIQKYVVTEKATPAELEEEDEEDGESFYKKDYKEIDTDGGEEASENDKEA